MATNNDIKYISFTFENEEQSNISPNDVEVEITALDKYKIAEYKFNNTLYDLIPEFNAEFTDYTYEDVVDGEVTTRTIYNNSLPTKIRFGIGNADSTGFDGREKALLEVLYLDNSNLITEEQMFQMCNNLTKVDGFVNNTMHIMNHMFAGCYDLTTVNASNWDTSNVQYMQYMFYDCPNLTSLDVNKWNTSNVTNMAYMFFNCNSLTTIDVSNFNTSKVTNMENMFCDCREITSLDIANWNTDKVTSMENMFYGCHKLSSLDVSNWNTNSVTGSGFKKIFADCYSLQSLDLTNWNTSNITDFIWLFTRCHNLTTLGDISNWNTSNVDCFDSMFFECRSLTELDLSGWDTSNVTDMGWMFHLCTSLNKLNISNWDTNSVTYIEGIFSESVVNEITMNNSDYSSVNKIISELPIRTSDSMGTLNIEGIDDISQVDITTAESKFWNVESGIEQIKVVEYKFTNSSDLVPVFNEGFVYTYEDIVDDTITIRTIYGTELPTKISFNGATRLLEVFYLDSSNIIDASNMFYGCTKLTNIVGIKDWDVRKITTMYMMFTSCTSLTELDLSNWEPSSLTTMYGMFYKCSKITSIKLGKGNTPVLKSTEGMFNSCMELLTIDFGGLNTSNVNNMGGTFSDCRKLKVLDISHWDVSKVTNFGAIFRRCNSLLELNLRNWDLSSADNITTMFESCSSIVTLELSDLVVDKVESLSGVFQMCSNLTTLNLNGWHLKENVSITNLFNKCDKLKNVNMERSDAFTVNKFIVALPTRSKNNKGFINIKHVVDFSDVNIKEAISKYWNVFRNQGNITDIYLGYDNVVKKLLQNKKIKNIYLGNSKKL